MQKSNELLAAYNRYIDTLATGDTTAIAELISKDADVSVIGNDHDEWLKGHDDVLAVTPELMQRVAAGVAISAGDPQAYVEGNIGWVADQPNVTLPAGSTTFRATMLFHKQDGEWRMLHAHTSFGLGNPVISAAAKAA